MSLSLLFNYIFTSVKQKHQFFNYFMEEIDGALLVINLLIWVFFAFSLAIYRKTKSDVAKYLSYSLAILSIVGLILLLKNLKEPIQSLLVPLIKNNNFP
jgi:Ca2+/H+ antiporter